MQQPWQVLTGVRIRVTKAASLLSLSGVAYNRDCKRDHKLRGMTTSPLGQRARQADLHICGFRALGFRGRASHGLAKKNCGARLFYVRRPYANSRASHSTR